MKRLLIVGFMIFVLWKLTGGSDQIALTPGVKVIESPVQQVIKGTNPFSFKGHTVSPLADFTLQAKVLAKENYHLGPESKLSPVDLALGWGQMSDQAIVDEIQFSQSGRWYRWSVQTFPIPKRTIETQSANMHMIPSTDWIENRLKQVKEGQIITLTGYLVRVDADKSNWHWQSSLTRDDVGAGACELIYLTDFSIIE
tara:strand:- start:115 stop:708 length:594 start_codon:yes stop_codon:yes gene_type:complete